MMENKKGGRGDTDHDKYPTTGEDCSVTSTVSASLPAGYGEFRPNAPKFGTVVPNRIFVGGIPDVVSVGELELLFSKYGHVLQAKIIVDRGGVPKGYGFITFETAEQAKKVQMDSNVTLREKRLNIAPAIMKQMSERVYPSLMSPMLVNPNEQPMSSGGGDNGQMNGGGGPVDCNNYPVGLPHFFPRRDDTTYFVPSMQYPYPGPVYHTLPNGPESTPQLMFSGYQGPYTSIPMPYNYQPLCYAPLTPIPNDSREPTAHIGPPIYPYPYVYGAAAAASPTCTSSSCPEGGSGSEASIYEPSDSYLRGPDNSAAQIIYYYNIVPPPTTVPHSPHVAHNLPAITDGSEIKKEADQDSPQSDMPQVPSFSENTNTDVQTPTSEIAPSPLLNNIPTRREYPNPQQQQQRMPNRPGQYFSRGPARGGGWNREPKRGHGNVGGGRSYEHSVNNNSTEFPNNYECDKKKGIVDSVRGARGGSNSFHGQSNPRYPNNFPRPTYSDRPPRPSNYRFLQPCYPGSDFPNNSMDTNRYYSSFGGGNRRPFGGRPPRAYGHSFSRGGGGSRYYPRGNGKFRVGQNDEVGEYEDSERARGHYVEGLKDESVENGVLTPPITPRSPRAGSPDNFTAITSGTSTASDVEGFNKSMAALSL